MAGANIRVEVGVSEAVKSISGVASALRDPKPLLQEINEYLLRIHRQRFKDQRDPSGQAWAPLSPRYQQRKKRNRNKILTLNGFLSGTLRGQIDEFGLVFGSDRIQAAALHFGRPEINLPSRKWLGTSIQDDENILRIGLRYLEDASA